MTAQLVIQRHRDVLYDAQREFRRINAEIRENDQRSSLLGDQTQSMRDNISQGQEYYLDERSRINQSHGVADQALE